MAKKTRKEMETIDNHEEGQQLIKSHSPKEDGHGKKESPAHTTPGLHKNSGAVIAQPGNPWGILQKYWSVKISAEWGGAKNRRGPSKPLKKWTGG